MSDIENSMNNDDVAMETVVDLENQKVAESALQEEVTEVDPAAAAQQTSTGGVAQYLPTIPNINVDSQQIQNAVQNAGQAVQNFQSGYVPQPEPPNVVGEVGAAIGGGALDAVDSVTGFAELTGDTLKTGMNQLFGKVSDPTQNPFHEDYISRELDWLDIPEEWKPENHTGWGKFAKGMV